MTSLFPIREKPALAAYKKGDVLVLFGELFNRGYGNGLVEEAEKRGMTIVRATVGRREKDGTLRALNAEEAALVPKPFINVPIEAGFDMEPAANGVTPVDQLKDVKLSDWESAEIDFKAVAESKQRGTARFRQSVEAFMKELAPLVGGGKNVLFAHLMAGGVPRTKIVMPLMNRAFKGTGDRYLASETFWNSAIGRLCAESFTEVTSETFGHLIDLSAPLRESIEKSGGHVSYVAYGYHGTEIFYHGKVQWQSYSPYLQGWAKLQLENKAKYYFAKGIHCCVYNCPEILTNSSSIFQGVEVPLYALTTTLKKEKPNHPETKKIIADCQVLLKEGHTLDEVQAVIDNFYHDPLVQQHLNYEKWPQHSSAHQLNKLLESSDYIVSLHKNEKALMTAVLSELVFKSCGYVMLHDSWSPKAPVAWIGHDLVVQCL